MATKVVENLGGHGVFGVEFFVAKDDVIFSELSPRPHDTGMVTRSFRRTCRNSIFTHAPFSDCRSP